MLLGTGPWFVEAMFSRLEALAHRAGRGDDRDAFVLVELGVDRHLDEAAVAGQRHHAQVLDELGRDLPGNLRVPLVVLDPQVERPTADAAVGVDAGEVRPHRVGAGGEVVGAGLADHRSDQDRRAGRGLPGVGAAGRGILRGRPGGAEREERCREAEGRREGGGSMLHASVLPEPDRPPETIGPASARLRSLLVVGGMGQSLHPNKVWKQTKFAETYLPIPYRFHTVSIRRKRRDFSPLPPLPPLRPIRWQNHPPAACRCAPFRRRPPDGLARTPAPRATRDCGRIGSCPHAATSP